MFFFTKPTLTFFSCITIHILFSSQIVQSMNTGEVLPNNKIPTPTTSTQQPQPQPQPQQSQQPGQSPSFRKQKIRKVVELVETGFNFDGAPFANIINECLEISDSTPHNFFSIEKSKSEEGLELPLVSWPVVNHHNDLKGYFENFPINTKYGHVAFVGVGISGQAILAGMILKNQPKFFADTMQNNNNGAKLSVNRFYSTPR
eukprot:Pgem_evm1s11702